jgi:hypothetical protein
MAFPQGKKTPEGVLIGSFHAIHPTTLKLGISRLASQLKKIERFILLYQIHYNIFCFLKREETEWREK